MGFIAFGNKATGFIAIGNFVTGVFAFGNVARGIVAVGNVAMGVVAIGNVGLGLVGIGASISAGIVAYGAAVAVPALEGSSLSGATLPLPFGGFLLCAVLLALSFIMRGRRPARPDLPPLVRLRDLLAGNPEEGWVRAQVLHLGSGRATVRARGVEAAVELTEPADRSLSAIGAVPRCLARLAVEERAAPDPLGGYRDVEHERVIRCDDVRREPKAEPFWSKNEYLMYPLAIAWRIGGPLAALLGVGRLVFGWW